MQRNRVLVSRSNCPGLPLPRGLVVDASGNVYIADSAVPAVWVFGPTTGVCRAIYNPTIGWLPISYPIGLAVDASSAVLVVDPNLNQ